MIARTRTVVASLVLGATLAIGLLVWKSPESAEDSNNAAVWIALARAHRVRIAALEVRAAHDSTSASASRGAFRDARATSDSLMRLFHTVGAATYEEDDTTRFVTVRRETDHHEFRVPAFLPENVAALQRTVNAASVALAKDSALDDARRATIAALKGFIFAQDSVIARRDERIQELARVTWRDRVAVTLGADYRGRPTLAAGWRLWPTKRGATSFPRAPLARPSLDLVGSDKSSNASQGPLISRSGTPED